MDHPEDDPPFAIVEPNSPQHLFLDSAIASPSPRTVSTYPQSSMIQKACYGGSSQISLSSSPPGLVESTMTDGSSLGPSTCDSDVIEQGIPRYLDASSTFLMSSLPSATSTMGSSSYLPNSRVLGPQETDFSKTNTGGASRGSAGFSQLLRAADDANVNLGQSTRMPMVPENGTTDASHESGAWGTLISAPSSPQETATQTSSAAPTWFPTFLSQESNKPPENLSQPLLSFSFSPMCAPLLSQSPSEQSIARAKLSVASIIEDDQSFEVSMNMDSSCTVQDVMKIVGNPELLKLWCDPIQTLIVTSSSDGGRDPSGPPDGNRGREYDAEWIEATTTALESPPSSVGFVYSAGQAVLETLGFASYGKITLFVERRRGQVGLTVGPFSGGIHAAHTITIFEDRGRIRVVDRVRLNHEENEPSIANMFMCGVLDSCFSSCLLPTLGSYMEQVSTSMARLRLLVENGELSQATEIVSAP